VPWRGSAGSGNVHPGSALCSARHGLRSRGIGPLDPTPAAGHAEDENRRRGNARERTSMCDGPKPGVGRKKVHHIEYVHCQPGLPRPCEPRRELAVVERAGLGRVRGRAGEHRPNHPNDGGVAGMMAVRRIRAERSPNRAAQLRQKHNTVLARMPPDTMCTGLARAAARGIQACGQTGSLLRHRPREAQGHPRDTTVVPARRVPPCRFWLTYACGRVRVALLGLGLGLVK
jgi:hypothetical protein